MLNIAKNKNGSHLKNGETEVFMHPCLFETCDFILSQKNISLRAYSVGILSTLPARIRFADNNPFAAAISLTRMPVFS